LVPIEDYDNWSWFFKHFVGYFPGLKVPGYVIMSDRNKGLDRSVEEELPEANHSHCCQHLAANVQTSFGLQCRNLFWSAAKAETRTAFDNTMAKIQEEKPAAYTYLNNISHKQWAIYAFPVS